MKDRIIVSNGVAWLQTGERSCYLGRFSRAVLNTFACTHDIVFDDWDRKNAERRRDHSTTVRFLPVSRAES